MLPQYFIIWSLCFGFNKKSPFLKREKDIWMLITKESMQLQISTQAIL